MFPSGGSVNVGDKFSGAHRSDKRNERTLGSAHDDELDCSLRAKSLVRPFPDGPDLLHGRDSWLFVKKNWLGKLSQGSILAGGEARLTIIGDENLLDKVGKRSESALAVFLVGALGGRERGVNPRWGSGKKKTGNSYVPL